MTDRFKNALVRMPDVKSDDIAEMAMDWYADNYETLKSALTLASESEQLRKELKIQDEANDILTRNNEQLRKELDGLADDIHKLADALVFLQSTLKFDHPVMDKAKRIVENGNA